MDFYELCLEFLKSSSDGTIMFVNSNYVYIPYQNVFQLEPKMVKYCSPLLIKRVNWCLTNDKHQLNCVAKHFFYVVLTKITLKWCFSYIVKMMLIICGASTSPPFSSSDNLVMWTNEGLLIFPHYPSQNMGSKPF